MNRNIEISTIGVYGFKEEGFFKALVDAKIDLFCDIRMRRGMRGSTFAFVNSIYLQEKLRDLGIRYLHIKDLAPTQEIRDCQKAVDDQLGVLKSTRSQLGDAFVEAYKHKCLDKFDIKLFLESLDQDVNKVAFFCVEREPEACHRSLVSSHLESKLGIAAEHLKP